MTVKDDILTNFGLAMTKIIEAQKDFLAGVPVKATVQAAITQAQTALNSAAAAVNAYDFRTFLGIADFPWPLVVHQNQPVNYQFVPVGGVAPYHFTVSGNMPLGLSLSPSGLLSGIEQAFPGYMSIDVDLQDATGALCAFGVWIQIVSP